MFGLNQVCSVSLMHVQVAIVTSKSVTLNDVIVLSFSFCIPYSNSAFTPTPNYTHTCTHIYYYRAGGIGPAAPVLAGPVFSLSKSKIPFFKRKVIYKVLV